VAGIDERLDERGYILPGLGDREHDRALLAGEFGPAASVAMKMLVRYGSVLGADSFISIQSAHIDGCLYHGQSSLDFVRRFVELGGQVRVPTTLNSAAVDTTHPGWHVGDPALLRWQSELTAQYEALGCIPTLTCAPYQRLNRPRLGEHTAWAESNAIVFANSVLGARTERYGDFMDLCAALTGRTPNLGLHRDADRRATILVEAPSLEATNLPRDLYFACIGHVAGERAGARVPAITGMPADATEDELKALGASAATSGAVALFHAIGITPEAATLEQATHGLEPTAKTRITLTDLRSAVASLSLFEAGEPIAAVCLGTPHFSMQEFTAFSRLIEGVTPADGVEIYVSTSREIAAQVNAHPMHERLQRFGVQIVVDTCTYLAPVVRAPSGIILTNSVKYAHYGPGNLKRRVGLMTLERCIRSAIAGKVTAP
jgi:predicted aconitase